MNSNRQIIGLDLIRFFAALLVVAFHFGYWIWADPDSTPAQAAMNAVRFDELSFLRDGLIGVDIFFVISGFIIAWSAEKASASQFFKSRVIRLMPAIFIIAPITLIVAVAVNLAPTQDLVLWFVRTITLWPFGPWIDGVYWTLPIEVAFYAMVFVLLLVQRFDLIELMAAAMGLVGVFFWLSMRWQVPIVISATDQHKRLLQLLLIYHGCFFAAGVYLWLILLNHRTPMRLLVFALTTFACLLSIWMEIHTYASCAIWAGAIAAIWPSVRVNKMLHRNGQFARLARHLGLMTYPLYLFHDVIGAAIIGGLVLAGVDRYIALATATAFTISASAVIAIWLEPRLQRLLRALLDGITAPQTA